MVTDYGPQYNHDGIFKAKSRLHQSRFRAEYLHADYKTYGNRLTEKDALQGKNFYLGYDGLFDEVKKRYPLKYSPLYYDMLRSEHIPFNFFIAFKYDKELGKHILNDFLGGVVSEIGDVKIEYAPDPKEIYLNDNTSFDAYIEYLHYDGTNGFIGIEVKYTELEYPYGKKERNGIDDPTSTYNRLTKRIGIYSESCLETLKTPKYKQVWRNQLLGERILEVKPKYKHFTSVILFPHDNTHFVQVCDNYIKFLKAGFESRFKAMTFENFLEVGIRYASIDSSKSWLSYLKSRYLVVD